jgi:FixJ family two-component response regulator
MSKKTGFDDFISKPLVEGRLYEILVKYLIDEKNQKKDGNNGGY